MIFVFALERFSSHRKEKGNFNGIFFLYHSAFTAAGVEKPTVIGMAKIYRDNYGFIFSL
jgi:hypothetical protein